MPSLLSLFANDSIRPLLFGKANFQVGLARKAQWIVDNLLKCIFFSLLLSVSLSFDKEVNVNKLARIVENQKN